MISDGICTLTFDEGVAYIHGMGGRHGGRHRLSTCEQSFGGERLSQVSDTNLHQLGRFLHSAGVGDGGGVQVVYHSGWKKKEK